MKKQKDRDEPSKKLADMLPKPRAASDLDIFMAGGMKAIKEKFIREDGPELLNKAMIMGFNMQQVATIIAAVKPALDAKGLDYSTVEIGVLKDTLTELLAQPKSRKKG